MMASMRARLAHLRRLKPPRNYLLLLHILGVAMVAPWLLRLPMKRVAKLVTPAQPRRTPEPQRIAQIVAYTDTVLRACQPLVQDRCLTRGLTLYYFLRRHGLPVALQFGVGYVDQAFTGHCWLEEGGVPFAEAQDPYLLFKPTYRLDGSATG
ncbi:MAG: lasso peptide biosynthesis B2 protein [Caldilineaceae bacterium]|nr:lasso peptide biosynthesis B2 protein [Caldilineaceae bacterium]